MRDDQFIRLQQLEEKLTEQFLSEADPVNWSADGILPKNMTQAERGDRYWCKKNAVATLALIQRIHSLSDSIRRASSSGEGGDTGAVTDDGEDLEQEMASAEEEAKRMLAEIQDGSKKKDYVKRTVNGKP
jgi:hypothetical protein